MRRKVINGLSLLNQNNVKTLIVINAQNEVIGTATDGDIEGISQGGIVQDSVDSLVINHLIIVSAMKME